MFTSKKTQPECRAKNPETCRYHGVGLTADSLFASYAKDVASASNHSSPVGFAVESPLTWDGKNPKWWKSYARKAENSKNPTTPKIIDVMETPEGQVAVVWEDESQLDNDRGLTMDSGYGVHVCYYKSMKTGETLGYVKMAYMDDKSFERSFGDDVFTPLRYAERYDGVRFGFRSEDYEDGYKTGSMTAEETDQQWRDIWYGAHRYNKISTPVYDKNGEYVPSYQLDKSHAPDVATIKEELAPYLTSLKKEIRMKRKYFNQPYVDFSRVEESLSGKGYGTALYVYTARMLGQQGKVLRGSSIQSPEAQTVWSRFEKKFPLQFKRIKLNYRGEISTAPYLDFRG